MDVAKSYLRERYADDPDARFGLIASSKDRELPRLGVLNDFPPVAEGLETIGLALVNPRNGVLGYTSNALVSIIDEHIFGDLKSFREQFANLSQEQVFQTLKGRLKPICQRTLPGATQPGVIDHLPHAACLVPEASPR